MSESQPNPSPVTTAASLRAVDLSSIPVDVTLPVDLYLLVNNKPVLFRAKGDSIAVTRLKNLQEFRVRSFFIQKAESRAFKDFLAACLRSGSGEHAQRASALREALFLQLREFEHSENLDRAIVETVKLFRDTPDLSLFGQSPLARLLSEEAVGAELYNHSVNVALYSIALAAEVLGPGHEVAWKTGVGALLHDVGDLRLQERLRGHADFLTREDWTKARQHTTLGLEILSFIEEVPGEVREIVHLHHESHDGTGFPDGLKGEQIPILARIVGVCDAYDTLTDLSSPRALPADTALEAMRAVQPGRFDPGLLEIFAKKP